MFKLFILLIVLVSVLSKELIRFPLNKKENRDFVAGILARGMKGIHSTVKLGKEGSVVINDYENSQYFGQVSLGSPAQNFQVSFIHYYYIRTNNITINIYVLIIIIVKVIFDTGSSDLWVASSQCDSSCGRHAKYNSAKSSTYIANGTTFDITYGSGPVSGFESIDVLNVGGLVVKNMEFAQVTDASGLGAAYKLGKFDGILGLAFPILSVNKVPTVFENIVSQGLVDSAEFAFYLGNENGEKGELVFGGVDSAHYTGSFTYVPLKATTYWEIHLDAMNAGSTSIMAGGQSAIVDSGTSLLTGPKDAVKKIADQIGAKEFVAGEYLVSCDASSLPNFDFIIGGNSYTLALSLPN